MADLYNSVAAYNAAGGNDSGATVGANARKVDQVYNTGTRTLVFLQISLTCTTDSLDTNYTNADSNFAKLMTILQQRIEIYGVGQPSGNNVTIVTSKDCLPMTAAEEADPGDSIAILEDAIDASDAFSSTNIYWGSKIEGWNIENDC